MSELLVHGTEQDGAKRGKQISLNDLFGIIRSRCIQCHLPSFL